MDAERGELLLSVRPRWERRNVLVLLAAGLGAVTEVARHYRSLASGKYSWDTLLIVVPWILLFVFSALVKPLKFYERGILLADPEQKDRRHFVHWEQIERYYWDGDRLYLVGTASTLKGGPVAGGDFVIPKSQQPEVYGVLARYASQKMSV